MIKEIAFTAYPAKDVAGLRKWYEDKLGLKFSGPYEEDGVEKYNEANVGGGYLQRADARVGRPRAGQRVGRRLRSRRHRRSGRRPAS